MVKKAKTQGSIYWDESSRGYHSNEGRTPYKRGRWVGERMVDGRRVRMRSADYDKVLQWLNDATKNDLLTLKGFDYSVDTKRNKLYNRYGREVKGRMNKGIRMYQLYKDGEKLCEVSFNRLAYAALHGIDVSKIPHNIIVTFDNGEYTLQYRSDIASARIKRERDNGVRFIENSLNKRKREIDILLKFYQTGDATELTQYVTCDIFQHVLHAVMHRHHLSIQRATDVATEGIEMFLKNAMYRAAPLTNITPNIIRRCNIVVANGKRKMEYKE